MTNMQRFYRTSLHHIECAINARACSEAMLYHYELQRKYILKCLLRWQLKEFDRS
jgi:hypothetical protein